MPIRDRIDAFFPPPSRVDTAATAAVAVCARHPRPEMTTGFESEDPGWGRATTIGDDAMRAAAALFDDIRRLGGGDVVVAKLPVLRQSFFRLASASAAGGSLSEAAAVPVGVAGRRTDVVAVVLDTSRDVT